MIICSISKPTMELDSSPSPIIGIFMTSGRLMSGWTNFH